MVVYRVERKASNGELIGMYTPCSNDASLWTTCTGGAQEDDYHPIPQSSSKLMDEYEKKEHLKRFGDYNFGFANKRQFLQWVYDPDWRHAMASENGVLNVYKVDARHVCSDDQQVMFIKSKAALVETLPVNHFDLKEKANVL